MFVDEVTLKVESGRGGNGKTSFFPGRGGPSGGNGGNGGNILTQINQNLSSLNKYAGIRNIIAPDGVPGGVNRRSGANGEDVILEVPIGTTIIDLDTREEFELSEINNSYLLCKGGNGGLGNDAIKTATNNRIKKARPGEIGNSRYIKIIQKLIADYGLIGKPNAGKSTLLNELTSARAKVANYPFTTLEPNLGVLNKKIIADIPGLIEGAAEGKGLGIKFLKHIEKVQLLLHCISVESTNVLQDFKTVMDELTKYNLELGKKDFIILLTKTDLVDEKEMKLKIKQLKKVTKNIYPISILDSKSIEVLKKLLLSK